MLEGPRRDETAPGDLAEALHVHYPVRLSGRPGVRGRSLDLFPDEAGRPLGSRVLGLPPEAQGLRREERIREWARQAEGERRVLAAREPLSSPHRDLEAAGASEGVHRRGCEPEEMNPAAATSPISMNPRAIASAFGPILAVPAGKKPSARSSARSEPA